jgi:predicted transcriptional regulator
VLHYYDTEVEDGEDYYYRVRANNRAGPGNFSIIVSGEAFGPPGPPIDIVAHSNEETVELSWSPPDDNGGRPIDGYTVYKGTSPDNLDPVPGILTKLTQTDDYVEFGNTYYYAVSAWNSIGEGAPSSPIKVTLSRTSPDPEWIPSLNVIVDDTGVILSWDTPWRDVSGPINGFVIWRGASPSEMEAYAEVGDVRSYADSDVEPGRTYYYKVAAVFPIGQGPFSVTKQASIAPVKEPVEDEFPWMLMVALVAVCMVSVGAVASTESGRYRWGLLLGPLTTRLKREEVLDNKTRHALLGIIITNPGIHYQAIQREFGLKNGVAAYHLDVLEREDYIRSVRDGRLKRFYSTDTKVPKDLRSTPDEVRQEILQVVEAQPGISQKRLVNELGIDGETVRYHLRVLVENGELRDAREGRHAVYFRDT